MVVRDGNTPSPLRKLFEWYGFSYGLAHGSNTLICIHLLYRFICTFALNTITSHLYTNLFEVFNLFYHIDVIGSPRKEIAGSLISSIINHFWIQLVANEGNTNK